jgi:hypothetical protein
MQKKSIYSPSGQTPVWQIAAGDQKRKYPEWFLNYGVGLIGGDPEKNPVKSFKNNVKLGHIFILRDGALKITAVGLVVSGYRHLERFDDVNGWSLTDAYRVKWCQLPRPKRLRSLRFGKTPSRFSRVHDTSLTSYAVSIVRSTRRKLKASRLPRLPRVQPSLRRLPKRLEKTIDVAERLSSLFWQEDGPNYHPAENELVALVVVPFLLALGWPPEQIALNWQIGKGKVDVAIFKKMERSPENCAVVIEAKRLGDGIEAAIKQARDYASQPGMKADVVLTDGIRYALYSRRSGYTRVSYANLANLKEMAARLFSRLKN